MRKLILGVLLLLSLKSVAQYNDFGFEKSFDILVRDSVNDIYTQAWLGGLNSCQFGQIDLNFDGIKDFVVFDRIGNKLLTFINNGTPHVVDYTYAPQYEKKFPYIHDWLFLVDYNNDGKEDIFTYSTGGMSVYKNESTPLSGIAFTKIVNVLNSYQGSSYNNLYVTEVELPAIADVNGDGCADVLVYHILGSYLNMHLNQSMIKYGNCDSLDFIKTDHCWGDFFENSSSNGLTLNITCSKSDGTVDIPEKEILHTGSTVSATDLDSNGLKDLLIGDTGFPNLIAAYNGGTSLDAHITSTDTTFPSSTLPLQLYSMPLPSIIDINNDGKKDLLASPFDGDPLLTESKKSIWYYKNNGTINSPVFEFQKKNFLQQDMIEVGTGAYPVFYDIDADGLTDLFVSNYGYRDSSYYENGFLYSVFISNISFYKNVGNAQQADFKLITEDFGGVSSLHLKAVYPTFGDIDGDSDVDMIIGEGDGTLLYFENISGVFAAPVLNYQNIDIGKFSTPQLVDLNKDTLLDLVIGDRIGRLHYYKNTGTTANPVFTLITDTLGGVDVKNINLSNYGYSVPCFFKDSLGEFRLFAGSESGKIYYYNNIDNNLTGTFTLKEQQLLLIYEGTRTGVSVCNLNNDIYPDMVIGNFSGGLNLYMGSEPQLSSINEIKHSRQDFSVYPNPTRDILNISSLEKINESDYTIEIYNYTGQLISRQNYYNQINVSNLRKGLYILRISQKTNSKLFNTKFAVY